MNRRDCIIIGHNDVDFDEYARTQSRFADNSAAYSEIKTNSVLHDGVRRTYMELLNTLLERATQRPSDLNAFKMPSLAVAYLVSSLRRRGLKVDGVSFFNSSRDLLASWLKDPVGAVAITTTYYVDDEPLKQVVAFVRRLAPRVTIIVGGPRILSLCRTRTERIQDLAFKSIGADIYIESSEGEATLSLVVQALAAGEPHKLYEIPNLTFRHDEEFVRNPRVREQNDLDANAIDWTTFPKESFTPTTYMRTARSCPFSCEFCNYPALAGDHTLAKLETIEKELQCLVDAGLRYLIFVDDTFNVPLPRFKNLCRMMIRNRFNVRWVSFFRCSNADDEAFDLMEESGCLGVYLGIESGDPQILENMRKFAKVERYWYGIQELRKRQIMTLASIIVGFPGETAASVQNTIDFLNAAAPTFYNVQVYYHDTQAPIERRRAEYGIKGSGYSWSHTSMNWEQAAEWKERMILDVSNSILLPLYGFSIWSLPYLFQHGFTLDQILQFARFANSLSRSELQGVSVDVNAAMEHFCHASSWPSPMQHSLGLCSLGLEAGGS